MKLLEYALRNRNYDLAARVLVYGLLKATVKEIEENGKKRGAPQGNQNARKHGFYSRTLTEAEALDMELATEVEGIDQEIALLRTRLRRLVEDYPERLDLQLEAANVIARLLRTRYQISKQDKRTLRDAIAKVLGEVAAPLGMGIGIGMGLKK
jgi:hypothetical protein